MTEIEYVAHAEYDRLNSVRVHTPGLELWSGTLDPGGNLFEASVPPERARQEHRRLIETYESAGVEVHQLADDLAAGDALDPLVREYVTYDEGIDLDAVLATLSPREKLGLALARARVCPGTDVGTDLAFEGPLSNTYFQRDTTVLGDRGPILCDMAKPVRRPEVDVVRRAWEAVDAEVVHEAAVGPIEGGEFLPVGEFALLGVSGVVDGKEEVLRTSYDAGRDLLSAGAVGYGEFGLVRAPISTARAMDVEAAGHDPETRLMHLLGWFNVAAEGLAVTFPDLAEAATVDVYERTADGYERDRSTDLLSYVRSKGYDVVAADFAEHWPTNFVAVDDGTVIAVYEPDAEGEYQPERNPTIEALRDRGVTILPDGTGLPNSSLTDGAGGFHCMTTPLSRG
jgi:arginine deiminase